MAKLRQVPVAGAPRTGRRPLRELDERTRAAIESAGDVIDRDAALAAWEGALTASACDGMPVWIHTDLLRPNLLMHDGRLTAVIDFGGIGVGDPAADLIAAWSVFGNPGREVFRRALEADDYTLEPGPRLRAPPGCPYHPALRRDQPRVRRAGHTHG